MNKVLSISLIGILLFIIVTGITLTVSERKDGSIKLVEDFSRFAINTFPGGWRSRGGSGPDVYRVRLDGDKYLEAKADGSAVTIAKKFEYDHRKYPVLKWQWRVVELPKGADERYKKTGDSGAGIYVIFPGLLFPETIKYVWSSSLPIGTVTESPFSRDTKIVVLRNHSSPLVTWVSEKVNVYDDFRKLFDREPDDVIAIGIMSDSDNTGASALAHYKKISVSEERFLDGVLCSIKSC
jgi:hypothetical protein